MRQEKRWSGRKDLNPEYTPALPHCSGNVCDDKGEYGTQQHEVEFESVLLLLSIYGKISEREQRLVVRKYMCYYKG